MKIKPQMDDIGTQHQTLIQSVPSLSTRVVSGSSKWSKEYNPKYLQAIGLMMSECLSAPLAINATYIMDATV